MDSIAPCILCTSPFREMHLTHIQVDAGIMPWHGTSRVHYGVASAPRTHAQTSGSRPLRSSRSPTALMRPACFSSAHVVMPHARRSHTSGLSSITSGGVRLCGSDAGPSRILMAPHGATRTSTPSPGALRSNRYSEYRTAHAHTGRGKSSGDTAKRPASLLSCAAIARALSRHCCSPSRPLSISCSLITGIPPLCHGRPRHGVTQGVWTVRMCCTAYVRAYVMRRAEDTPPRLETMMPTYICHVIRKPRNTTQHSHVPTKSDQPRMPRHTSCNRQKTPHAIRKLQYQLVYVRTYTNRKTRTDAGTFRLHLIRHVCHSIRNTTDGRRSGPAWDRNADLRMPRHTGRHGNRKAIHQSGNQTPPRPATGHIFADNVRGGSPHRTLHMQCKASASLVCRSIGLPACQSTGLNQSTGLLVYRFRRSRPFRPALALT